MNSVKPSLEHIRLCLKRYGEMCSDTNLLLSENKDSILETLTKLEEDLQLFVKHTSMDSASKRKEARSVHVLHIDIARTILVFGEPSYMIM